MCLELFAASERGRIPYRISDGYGWSMTVWKAADKIDHRIHKFIKDKDQLRCLGLGKRQELT
ncbi:hypothetical protein K380107A5_08660 [Holdemania massiliensis]